MTACAAGDIHGGKSEFEKTAVYLPYRSFLLILCTAPCKGKCVTVQLGLCTALQSP